MSSTTTKDGSIDSKKGTVEWELGNLNMLKYTQFEDLNIGGLQWEMQSFLQGEKYMFTLFCKGKHGCFYICKTTTKLEMMEKGSTNKAAIIEDFGSQHWINCSDWSLSTEAAKITSNGIFPKMLRLHIEIIWAPSEESLPTVDAILDVKWRRFPVNQYILAGHSAYFQRLFFGPRKDVEKKQQAVTNEINGKPHYKVNESDAIDFCMMLCGVQLLGVKVHELDCLQAMRVEERVDRCMTILRMAAKYELSIWLNYAEKMLISTGPGTMQALELGESLNLPALKEHCLTTLDLLDYNKNFGANQRIYGRLSEQTKKRVDARLEENAKQYSRKRKRLDVEEDNDNDEN